jgi:hypothetical protein
MLLQVSAADGTLPAHVTTLTIGQVLFQVFTVDFVAADKHQAPEFDTSPPEPFARALTRIWPVEQQKVHWPQRYYITPDIFGRVVKWKLQRPTRAPRWPATPT